MLESMLLCRLNEEYYIEKQSGGPKQGQFYKIVPLRSTHYKVFYRNWDVSE